MAFQDRFEAGPLLASRLVDLRDSADIVVLTLRGAVPVRLRHGVARVLVVYFPRSKRRTRYLTARLAAQFDAVIHVDQTHATGDHLTMGADGETPETYPSRYKSRTVDR